MKVADLAEAIGARLEVCTHPEAEVLDGYTSDLLSDVMGNAGESVALITIQAHRNTVAVASQLDFPAVIICNDREIPADMAQAAQTEGVAILCTSENQFKTSYRVHCSLFPERN